MNKILLLGGLVVAGIAAYLVLGSSGGATPGGGSGGTKKGMDPVAQEYTETITTTEGGLGVETEGFTINLPPMQTINFPPLPNPGDYRGGGSTARSQSKKQTVEHPGVFLPRDYGEFAGQRETQIGESKKGTPTYTFTESEINTQLSNITLGGFKA